MKTKAIFYPAGRPVCRDAERSLGETAGRPSHINFGAALADLK